MRCARGEGGRGRREGGGGRVVEGETHAGGKKVTGRKSKSSRSMAIIVFIVSIRYSPRVFLLRSSRKFFCHGNQSISECAVLQTRLFKTARTLAARGELFASHNFRRTEKRKEEKKINKKSQKSQKKIVRSSKIKNHLQIHILSHAILITRLINRSTH